MRSSLAQVRLVAFFLAAAFAAAAVGARPAGAATEQRAFLELTVNTVAQGQALVVLRDPDILIRTSDLTDAGVHGFTGEHSTVAGIDFVSLLSLRPGITFAYDESKLALTVTAAAAFFTANNVDLSGRGRRTPVDARTASGFVNYSLGSDALQGYTAFFETGFTSRGRLWYSSFDRNPNGGFSRGITNLTIDDPQSVHRLVLGDTFASAGDLGGTARLAGIGISRAYDVNPYFVRSATPGLSGTVLTPSTVDVYVNGRLDREVQVAPGTFNLNNIPLTAGTNDTRVVIRDAFGREQTINSPYYLAPQMLRRGLTDYSYNAGFKAATTFAGGTTAYGPASFLGRYQLGVSDSFNAGGRIEGGGGLISGGPMFLVSRPFGQVGLAAAGSSAGGRRGGALSVSYGYTAFRQVTFGANLIAQSRRYANLSLDPLDDRALLDESAYVGFPLGTRATMSVRWQATTYRDAGRQAGLALNGDLQLGTRTSLFFNASRINASKGVLPNNALANGGLARGGGTTVFAGVNYRLGAASNAYASLARAADGSTTATTQIDRAAPVGPGFGYHVQSSTGTAGEALGGTARYQGAYGDYELRLDRPAGGGSSAASVNVSGGIAAIGGGIFATRPLTGSFALVDAGVANVRTYLNNQDIGRTNRNGEILVPGLLPYLDNQLSIAPQDTPMNYSVESSQRMVAPTARGGTVVRFPVRKYQAYAGRIVIDRGGIAVVPAFGRLRLTPVGQPSAAEATAELDESGEFYVDTIAPGRYQAEVAAAGTACRFTMNVLDSERAVTKLGTLRCIAEVGTPKS